MRVLLTGGGTGGHIYPALAIGRGLLAQDPSTQLLYVGTSQGLEADLVPKEGIPFKTITIMGLDRKLSFKTLQLPLKIVQGTWQAWAILRSFKPDVVIGTGGYVCGPVVLMATFLKIPTLIHEQNAFPGITNKILASRVNRVAVTFSDSIKHFSSKANITLTGLPIRPAIMQAQQSKAFQKLGLDPTKTLIVVMGGSRGARSINLAMAEVYKAMAEQKKVQILHITGQAGFQETLEHLAKSGIAVGNNGNITIKPYLYNMEDALAAAGLMICRAGATTLAEITALGVPAILVPYPYAAENHQEFNARSLEAQGAARVILDRDLKGSLLVKAIEEIFTEPSRLTAMAKASKELGRINALEDILNCVKEITKR